MPIKRRDGMFYRVSVAALKKALVEIEQRYGDQAHLDMNALYNMAVLTPPGENLLRQPSHRGIGLFYAGYIDLTTGNVVWGQDEANDPFRGDLVVVGGDEHARIDP